MTSKQHFDKVTSYIELAKREGGEVLCGGSPPASMPKRCRDGWFIEPTVISGLGANCRTNQEEIFGPVVTILPFESEADGIAMANSTPYGLAASIWTKNLDKAMSAFRRVQAGRVWVNTTIAGGPETPIGGFKQSGHGRETGIYGVEEYTEVKTVHIALGKRDLWV